MTRPPGRRKLIVAALLLSALVVAAFLVLRPQDDVAVSDGRAGEPTTTFGASTMPGAPGSAGRGGGAPDGGSADGGSPDGPGVNGRGAPGGGGPGVAGRGTADPGLEPTTDGGGEGGGIPSAPVPATPLDCGDKGTPQQTAQRVICAWEKGRLGEVADSVTPEAGDALLRLTPARGQIAGPANAEGLVSFDRCELGKGVASVRVGISGPSSGRVHFPVSPCDRVGEG